MSKVSSYICIRVSIIIVPLFPFKSTVAVSHCNGFDPETGNLVPTNAAVPPDVERVPRSDILRPIAPHLAKLALDLAERQLKSLCRLEKDSEASSDLFFGHLMAVLFCSVIKL